MDYLPQNTTWPGWETVRLIGRGSFGAVYEIQREIPGRLEKAALKVISIPQNDSDIEELYGSGYDEDSITTFFQSHRDSIVTEYSIMRDLSDCVNVVNCDDIHYIQHDDGIGWDIYIKMELLTPLTKSLPAEIPEETVVKLAKDISAALEACEQRSLIHRDIKPQNIFVSAGGHYKLGDFGIAKTVEKTMGGTRIGTYKYMAPEVYNNQTYGTSADIYSLGLVLYWLLNERRMPFQPLPPEKLTVQMDESSRNRRLSGEALPAPKNGSEELKRIVLKACAFDPKDRYASAEEMLADLNGGFIDEATRRRQEEQERDARERAEQERIAREQEEAENLRRVQEERTQQALQEEQKRRQTKLTECWRNRTIVIASMATTVLIAVPVLLLLVGFFTIHSWTTTTCTEDSVCKICGKIRNSASGHSWLPATCTAPQICSVCGMTQGTSTGHNWLAATCMMPQTCSTCDKTTGSVLEHQWKNATCEMPQYCTVCNATRGEALGHLWTEASFIAPKTCIRCDATEGEPRSYAQIDVSAEISAIQTIYYHIRSLHDAGKLFKHSMRNGVDGYFTIEGSLVYAVVHRGTEGVGSDSDIYSRSYYYSNGKLVFAFFEGKDSHRLYFYDEYLMRWLYRSEDNDQASVYSDFTFSDEFLKLEKLAKDESASICN